MNFNLAKTYQPCLTSALGKRRNELPIKHSGFSLIELLVVITIIAILASILMPTIKMVRQAAQASACMHNLSQLHVGISGYALDYEALPQSSMYFIQVLAAEYLDSAKGNSDGNLPYDVLKCRADRRPFGSPGPDGGAAEGAGYVQCAWGNSSRVNITSFTRVWSSYAANTNAFTGTKTQVPATLGMFWDFYSMTFGGEGRGLTLHKQGLNMVFGDGHCEYLNMAPIKPNEAFNVVSWAVDQVDWGIRHVGWGTIPNYGWANQAPWK